MQYFAVMPHPLLRDGQTGKSILGSQSGRRSIDYFATGEQCQENRTDRRYNEICVDDTDYGSDDD